jgi:basic amino acid/polyamine antiporter, APA family
LIANTSPSSTDSDTPVRYLGTTQAVVLALGMTLTIDTLKTSTSIALTVGHWHFYLMWVLGGVLSMIGALCYAEMGSAFPHPGGDYHFLRLAYGTRTGALFAWSRFAVMHTGWIALMSFMLTDYVQAVLPMSPLGYRLVAMSCIALIWLVNQVHVRVSFTTQTGLVVLLVAGFASLIAAAMVMAWRHQAGSVFPAHQATPGVSAIATALIYIFLAYGGWNDMATLSTEVRDRQRGVLIAMVGGMSLLIAIYLLINAAMVAGLGIDRLAHSGAPAADLLKLAFGAPGAWLITIVVCVAAIGSIHSTLIVGARTTYAAASDLPGLGQIGRWRGAAKGPASAALVECLMAMVLVWIGSYSKQGFNTMVDYMTPIFWAFMLLSSVAVIVLRWRYPEVPRPFKAPMHPLLPGLFSLFSLYMLVSSLQDLGHAAWYGVAVLSVGAIVIEGLLRRGTRTGQRPIEAGL